MAGLFFGFIARLAGVGSLLCRVAEAQLPASWFSWSKLATKNISQDIYDLGGRVRTA